MLGVGIKTGPDFVWHESDTINLLQAEQEKFH